MSFVVGDYVLENSRSRSGRHRRVSTLIVYSRGSGVVPPSQLSKYVVSEEPVKPIYSRGSARRVKLRLDRGDYVVYGRFVKNFLGRVKGFVEVYSYRGELLYRAKYVSGSLRKSAGNPINAWLVRLYAEHFKIPVRETRLGDESE